MRCSTSTSTKRPERPVFSLIERSRLSRRIAAPIGMSPSKAIFRPPNINRGRPRSGIVKPRCAAPSSRRPLCRVAGLNSMTCQPRGSGSPGRNSPGSRSSKAAIRRASESEQTSSAYSTSPAVPVASFMPLSFRQRHGPCDRPILGFRWIGSSNRHSTSPARGSLAACRARALRKVRRRAHR